MGFQLENIQTVKKQHHKNDDKTAFLQKEINLFGNSFSNKIKEDFYTELSVLLKAGITLKDALELIESALKKKNQKEKLKNISKAIVSGSSLSEATSHHKEFSEYEYYSLKIGEETGTLIEVTKQLGEFYARKNEQRRNLVSALTYPTIILATAILVVVFMLNYVVPMFQDIFEQQKVELPAITKFIINCSQFLKSYGWFLLLGLIIVIGSRALFNKKQWYKKIKDKFISKLPFIGEFVKTVYLSQFTQAVSLLTASKVPVVNSIQLVKQMINFYPLQNALASVEQDILKGKSLSNSLKPHPLFDDKMVALVKVAEETNQNEFIFQRLNVQYNTQVQQKSKLISTLLEPVIIMIVGLLVGVILIAMYLPMFKLSSVLG
ncbi:type II secretion system F family protein [Winogradskyella sp.]|uniref:type II secretion system F family protein n=1 Tax=Winogradskyella sp. TaxID=1883156 RepID=UPI0026228433|nr:type II secretion system F family protein [Winogradskyella sp.]